MVLPVPSEAPELKHAYLRAPVPLEFPEEELRMPDGDEHLELRILLWQSARLAFGRRCFATRSTCIGACARSTASAARCG